MSKTAEYSIKINGLRESADATDVLIKQLDLLEQRIDALNKKGVSVSKAIGGSSSNFSQEEKIVNQINDMQEKRIALESELGKELANEKALMKEINAEAKAAAASERLGKGGYASNTMLGMKQELADIKMAMQTMDMGSSEFEQATQRALDLTNQLKSAEEAFGTFSRNVGNYSNDILNAFKQITVQVGDTELKFNSTKEALKSLREGLKGMVVNGEEGTEQFKQMSDALHELEMASDRADSAVQDLQRSSSGMDNLLDTMQSFAAIGNVSGGFSNLFGIGGDFQQSIQKLMSLQSILQGLESLQKQMNTGEGLGKYFGSASKSIDEFSAKLFRVKGGMEGLGSASKATSFAVKGLSTVMKGLAGVGIGLLIEGAMKLAEKVGNLISGWISGNENLVDSNKGVAASIQVENEALEKQKKDLENDYEAGKINAQQMYEEQLKLTTNAILLQIQAAKSYIQQNDELSKSIKKQFKGLAEFNGDEINTEWYTPKIKPKDIDDLTESWEKFNAASEKRITIWEELVQRGELDEKVLDQLGKKLTSVEDTEQELANISRVAMAEVINRYEHAMQTMATNTEEGKKEIMSLYDLMNNNKVLQTIFMRLDEFIPDEATIAKIRNIQNSVNGLYGTIAKLSSFDLKQLGIDTMAGGLDKELAQIELNYDKALKAHASHLDEEVQVGKKTVKVWEALEIQRQNQIDEARERYAKKDGVAAKNTVNAAKATGKKVVDIEKEIQRAKLDAMADGLTKEITKLEQERNERLKKVEGNKQAEADINTYYNQKIADEQKKWHKEIEDGYKDLWNNIFSFTIETTSKLISTNESAAQRIYEDMIEYNEGLWENYFDSAAKVLNDDENLNLMKPLDVFKARIEQLNNVYEDAANESIEKLRKTYDLKNELLQKQKDKELQETSEWYNESIDKTNDYYDKLIDDTREKMKQLSDEEEEEKDNLQSDIEMWEQERTDRVLEIREQFYSRRSAIDKEYEEKQNELERQQYQDSDRLNKDHIDKQLGELRAFYNEINKLSDAQPVRNAFGFIKVGDTNKINKEVLDSLEEYKTQLQGLGEALNILRKTNSITYSTWYTANEEINRQIEGINSKIKETKANLSWEGKLQDFFNVFQQYYSELASAVQQVWGELDNLANYNLDLQQDALDKENEALQKKLDEQEEILEKHKERVDDIEGKLQEARGDRKDALIDALNAEIIAQRRAQAEKERLEKEQEKLEEKQKELDYQRDVNDYHSGLRQILFNTSQAIMSAAVNKWPTPAIPLMALATAAGAAQYALAAKQRPIKKAEGGLLEGASHANGGIPVGMTGIEVEGGEYVIRKSSTNENIELLDFINNSKRKLYADDLINFFRNDRQRFIANTAKTRFADGGILDIADNSSFNLGSAFAAYSDRPIVVSVVDINERQSEVQKVRVLSGLN